MGLKWAGHVALIEDTKKYIQSLSRKTWKEETTWKT
jgi:hypothetical protein